MPKQPTQAQRAEFSRLRAFVQTLFETVWTGRGLSTDNHPSVVADRMWVRSPTSALRGIRQAATDMVEATQDFEGASLGELESRLAAAGAPSLACMRDRRVQQVFKLLQQGEIRTDDEARLLQTVLSDTADRILDSSSTSVATAMLADYER
jgi:hypothetical protein